MNIINDYINEKNMNEQPMKQESNEHKPTEHSMNEQPINESEMTYDEYGNKFWKNAQKQLHKTDGPAVEYSNGDKRWYLNGHLHRPSSEGPAIECVIGDKYWYHEGKLHRPPSDGAAVEMANGDKYWYYEGKLHRPPSDGPAIELSKGHTEYFFQGKSLTKEEVDRLRKNQSNSKTELKTNSVDILIQSINEYNFDLFKQTLKEGVVVENWNLSNDPSKYDNVLDCVLENNAPMQFLSYIIESLNNKTITMDVNANQGRILKMLLNYSSLGADQFIECMKYKGFKFTFPANADFESPIYKQCARLGYVYLEKLIAADDYDPDYLHGYLADCLIEKGDYSDFCKYLYPLNGKSPNLNVSSEYDDTRNSVTYCVNQGRVNILGAMLKYQSTYAFKQLEEIPMSAIYQAVVYNTIDPVISQSMLQLLCEWMRKNGQQFYFDEYMAHILKNCIVYKGKQRFVKFANHLTVDHLKLLDGLITTSTILKMINLSSNDLNNRLVHEILQDMYERKSNQIITYNNVEYMIERKRQCDCNHADCETILLACKPYKRIKL
jgi:hypothetical protein